MAARAAGQYGVSGQLDAWDPPIADRAQEPQRLRNAGSALQVVALDAHQVLDRGVVKTDPQPRAIVFDGSHDSEEERRVMTLLQGETDGYVSLQTNGNGGCALHAPFGDLDTNAEFFRSGARLQASRALRALRDGPREGRYLRQKVLTSLWCELAKPVVLYQRGQGDIPSEAVKL